MTRSRSQLPSVAALLGTIGGGLGIVAGLIQATIGRRIPAWSGNKDSHLALGLLTIALGASVLVAVRTLHGAATLRAETLTAITLWLATVALLCSTTVGRLWVMPGALLLAAAGVSLAACGWRRFRLVVAANWLQGLVGFLGALALLMAVSDASATTVAAGLVAGGALIAAAIMSAPGRRTLVIVLVAATLPLVAMTWWTIVTPVLTVVALAISLAATGGSADGGTGAPPDRQPVR